MTGTSQCLSQGTAIVTGAASGIGRAVTRSLAEDHFTVYGTDINQAGLVSLEHEARAKGWQVRPAVMDVRDPDAVQSVLRECNSGDEKLTALVHCAGITWRGPLLEMPLLDYEAIVSTNLTGSYLCLTSVGRYLVAQGLGGAMVVITSVNAVRPLVRQAVYSATKAAVEVLVRTLAVEVGASGVRVNAVAAGAVDTPMNPGEGHEALFKQLPVGRIGRPEDIASAVRFLLSDGASYITGSSLVVDGGLAEVRAL